MKAWKPFCIVCDDVPDSFGILDALALSIDMIIFDIIEGVPDGTYKLPYKPLDFT